MSEIAYLFFRVSGTRCAVPSAEVLHICAVVGFEPITIMDAEPPLLGLCQYSGRTVVGIDLARSLGAGPGLFDADARMCILSGSEFLYAIPVDVVEDLYLVDIDQCNKLSRPSEFIGVPSVREVFQYEDRAVCLVDCDHLLSSAQREQLRYTLALPTAPAEGAA
jgi:chemotaxis signal transduction protein